MTRTENVDTTTGELVLRPGERGVAAPVEPRELTADEMHARVQLLQQVMRRVMVLDTHYGTIPGTPKPTLYKAGSEVILTTFRIAVEPEVIDLSTPDEVRYRVRCRGVHQVTGQTIGYGIGECSSQEKKYAWRRPVCDQEFDATPPDRRRVDWQRGKGGASYQVKQVRTHPADVANTVLKMAKKRAQIDLTLTATAASDLFDQDLEDLPPEHIEGREAPASRQGNAATRERMRTKRAPTPAPAPAQAGTPPEAQDDSPAEDAENEAAVLEAIDQAADFEQLTVAGNRIVHVADPAARSRLRTHQMARARALRGDA